MLIGMGRDELLKRSELSFGITRDGMYQYIMKPED